MIVETHLQNTQPITQATTSWPGQFFIKNLFAEFNRSNIRYAVMRNYQNLPGSTDGSDLDIIVHPVNKNIAKKIIFDVINRSNGVPIGHVNMPGFLKIFVLGFLKEEEKEHSKGTLTGKFFELLPLTPPILAIARADSEIGHILKETNKGQLCTIKEEISKFIKNIDNNRFFFVPSSSAVHVYSRRAQAEKLCKLLTCYTAK